MNKDKSVLDGIKQICVTCGKTKEEHIVSFPCYERIVEGQHGGPQHLLKVVSSCPKCGAPIYGCESAILFTSGLPTIKYSCTCLSRTNWADQQQTK